MKVEKKYTKWNLVSSFIHSQHFLSSFCVQSSICAEANRGALAPVPYCLWRAWGLLTHMTTAPWGCEGSRRAETTMGKGMQGKGHIISPWENEGEHFQLGLPGWEDLNRHMATEWAKDTGKKDKSAFSATARCTEQGMNRSVGENTAKEGRPGHGWPRMCSQVSSPDSDSQGRPCAGMYLCFQETPEVCGMDWGKCRRNQRPAVLLWHRWERARVWTRRAERRDTWERLGCAVMELNDQYYMYCTWWTFNEIWQKEIIESIFYRKVKFFLLI